MRVVNRTRTTVIGDFVDVARTSTARRTGLSKHTLLNSGEGLWIVPCEGVHTFGMNFPIDVLFLSKDRRVLKIRDNMVRGRMSFCLRAHSVLEIPAGTAGETGTEVGDQLDFEK